MKRQELVERLINIRNWKEITSKDLQEYCKHFADTSEDLRRKVLTERTMELMGVALKHHIDNAATLLAQGHSTMYHNGMLLIPKQKDETLRKKWENYIPDGTSPDICKMAINKILGMRM